MNAVLTYRSAAADKAEQLRLLVALGAWDRALRRDEAGAWTIFGKAGHIYTYGKPGHGWLLVAIGGESRRQWTSAKKRLGFCRVTADGDAEGCLHLADLPTADQAKTIRDSLGIRKRTVHSAETLLRLRETAFKPAGKRGFSAVDRVNGAIATDLPDSWKTALPSTVT